MVQRRDFRRAGAERQPGFFSRWSVTWMLILATVVLFFLFLLVIALAPEFINQIAVQPGFVLSGERLWTVFTSIFMHAGFFHLFVNMFSLFFLGSLTERIIGRKRYFWFYIT